MESASRTVRYLEHGRVLRMADAPPLEVLKWLRQFEADMRSGTDMLKVWHSFICMLTEKTSSCHCSRLRGEEDATDRWIHAHHAAFNRATWEIIMSVDGLLDFLRAALEADLAGPKKPNGRCVGTVSFTRLGIGRNLQGFLVPKPSKAWIGDPLSIPDKNVANPAT